MINRIILVAVAAVACTSAQYYPSPSPCCCSAPRPLYRVTLDHCGPAPCPAPPLQAPPAQAPAIHKPPVALPACIPPTKVISATASCLKTVLKAQPYQQQVSVPIISQFLQTVSKPVTEVITFEAIPCCPGSSAYNSAPAPFYGLAPRSGLGFGCGLGFPPALPSLGCGVPPPLCFPAPPSVTIPGCPGLYVPGSGPICIS